MLEGVDIPFLGDAHAVACAARECAIISACGVALLAVSSGASCAFWVYEGNAFAAAVSASEVVAYGVVGAALGVAARKLRQL